MAQVVWIGITYRVSWASQGDLKAGYEDNLKTIFEGRKQGIESLPPSWRKEPDRTFTTGQWGSEPNPYLDWLFWGKPVPGRINLINQGIFNRIHDIEFHPFVGDFQPICAGIY